METDKPMGMVADSNDHKPFMRGKTLNIFPTFTVYYRNS